MRLVNQSLVNQSPKNIRLSSLHDHDAWDWFQAKKHSFFLEVIETMWRTICWWDVNVFRDEAIRSVRWVVAPNQEAHHLGWQPKKNRKSEICWVPMLRIHQKQIVQKKHHAIGYGILTFRSHFLFGTFRHSQKYQRNPNKIIWVSVACRQ